MNRELPIYIFTQAFRQPESLRSEFNNGNLTVVPCGDSHYLHWTEGSVTGQFMKETLE